MRKKAKNQKLPQLQSNQKVQEKTEKWKIYRISPNHHYYLNFSSRLNGKMNKIRLNGKAWNKIQKN